ncbi:MAG: carbamoyl-phosphate synthase large subunit, partial [Deltaproteobacteria bacterium]|nr:carbamoyl-phosphate synthase large subunit [Deltaproteobacteria bacterium]
GIRSLEISRYGLGADGKDDPEMLRPEKDKYPGAEIKKKLAIPNSQRLFYLRYAILNGMDIDFINQLTGIDPWFLDQLKQIIELEEDLKKAGPGIPATMLQKAKTFGFSDIQLAYLAETDEEQIKRKRIEKGILPVYKLVDTCAAEFKAATPYYYSTYEEENEARVSEKKKVMILGGGPNRIGQGIEFDYCCVHASFALKEDSVESIMVNSNPETVSTDYDTSDKLYFEPLTKEDVLHIVEIEKPMGVIVQFGGQTPLNLSSGLFKAGVKILGTQPDSIDRAEDRELFQSMLNKLGLVQPPNGTAMSVEGAEKAAEKIGFPVIVRPSYVLGGRAMKIVYDSAELKNFTLLALDASPEHPVLIDKFLEDAVEIDVDAISDGKSTIIAGIMEHIEEAGVHSGDSACVLPPYSIKKSMLAEISRATKAMAQELNVIGLMNVQYAIKNNKLFVLEVNPRASRTIPFVSKATGIPFAKLAVKIMIGRTLKELGLTKEVVPKHISVKEAVLPFDRFPNVDTLLGPEMKSTGEVMGIDYEFGAAYAKAQEGAGTHLPVVGTVFISVQKRDKKAVLFAAHNFVKLGFKIMATRGTWSFFKDNGIESKAINKVSLGRPHVVDAVKNGEIQLIINTGSGGAKKRDGFDIRQAAIKYKIPYATTIAGGIAMCKGIVALKNKKLTVKTIQEYNN